MSFLSATITRFKPESGKYYDWYKIALMRVAEEPLFKCWEDLAEIRQSDNITFIWLVDIPGHPDNHPHLIL